MSSQQHKTGYIFEAIFVVLVVAIGIGIATNSFSSSDIVAGKAAAKPKYRCFASFVFPDSALDGEATTYNVESSITVPPCNIGSDVRADLCQNAADENGQYPEQIEIQIVDIEKGGFVEDPKNPGHTLVLTYDCPDRP